MPAPQAGDAMPAVDKKQLWAALLRYCGLDTIGVIRLRDRLFEPVWHAAPVASGD